MIKLSFYLIFTNHFSDTTTKQAKRIKTGGEEFSFIQLSPIQQNREEKAEAPSEIGQVEGERHLPLSDRVQRIISLETRQSDTG